MDDQVVFFLVINATTDVISNSNKIRGVYIIYMRNVVGILRWVSGGQPQKATQ